MKRLPGLAIAALLVVPAFAHASVTYDYVGFSITFSDNIAPTSAAADNLSSGLEHFPDSSTYAYEQSAISAAALHVVSQQGVGPTSSSYSISVTAAAGWQLAFFDTFQSGVVSSPTGAPGYDGDGYIALTGSGAVSNPGASGAYPGNNPNETAWMTGYNITAQTSPRSGGYTGLDFSGYSAWNGTNQDINFSDSSFSVTAVRYSVEPVPEPETWALTGLGMVALLARYRRRKAQA